MNFVFVHINNAVRLADVGRTNVERLLLYVVGIDELEGSLSLALLLPI